MVDVVSKEIFYYMRKVKNNYHLKNKEIKEFASKFDIEENTDAEKFSFKCKLFNGRIRHEKDK